MRGWSRLLWIAPVMLAAGTSLLPPARTAEPDGNYPDPRRFEKAIAAFEAQDERQLPPAGAVVCTGSSSMRIWHKTIAADLAPITVIPRGFGGSNMNDLLHYADRVILRYQPRAVVIYEGDNDVAQKIPPARILATFKALGARIHDAQPATRIYVLAIKPSVAREKLWPQAVQANRLLAAACAEDERLTYVDIATPMMGKDGRVRRDLFLDDQLHMNRAGYEIWRDQLRPILLRREARFEKRKAG